MNENETGGSRELFFFPGVIFGFLIRFRRGVFMLHDAYIMIWLVGWAR